VENAKEQDMDMAEISEYMAMLETTDISPELKRFALGRVAGKITR
jgi:hypothetical protein